MSSFTSPAVIGGGTAPPGGGNTQFVSTGPSTHQDTTLKNRTFYHRYEAVGESNGSMPVQQQQGTAPPSSARDPHSVQNQNQQRHGHQMSQYSRGLATAPYQMQQDPSAYVSYIQPQQQSFKGSESAVVFDSMSGPAIYMQQPHPNLRAGTTVSDRSIVSGQLVNGGMELPQQNHQHFDMDPYGARGSFENFRRFGGTPATSTSNLCDGTAVPSSAGIPSVVGTVSSSYMGANSMTPADTMGTNLPQAASSRHQLICVAERLLQDYYTRLSQQPSTLASLYLDDAEVIYTGRELNTDAVLVTGKTEIEEFFSSETASKFSGARVMVEALHPLVSPLSPYAVVLFAKGRVWFPRLSSQDCGDKSASDKRSLKSNMSTNDMTQGQDDTFGEQTFKRNASQQGSNFIMSAFYHYLCMAPHPKCPNWGAPLQYFVANEHFHLSNLPLSFPVHDLEMKNSTSSTCEAGGAGSRVADMSREMHTQQYPIRNNNEDFRMSVAASIHDNAHTDPFPPLGESGSVLMSGNNNSNVNSNRMGMKQHNILSIRQNRQAEHQQGNQLPGSRLMQNPSSTSGFPEDEHHSSFIRESHSGGGSLSKVLERKKGKVASGTSQLLEEDKGLGQHDSEDKSSSVKNVVLSNGRLTRGDLGSSSSSKGFNSNRYVKKNEHGGPPSANLRTGRRNQINMTGSSSGSLMGGQSSFGIHQSEFSLHAAPSKSCDLPTGLEELKAVLTEGINQVAGCETSSCVDIYRPRNQDPSRPFFFIYVNSHQCMTTLKAIGSITVQGNKKILLSPVKPPRSSYRPRFNNGNGISNSAFMRRTMQSVDQQPTNTTSIIAHSDKEAGGPAASNATRSYTRSSEAVNRSSNGENGSSLMVNDNRNMSQTVQGGPSTSPIINNRSGNLKGPFQRNRWGRGQGSGGALNRNTYNSSHSGRLGKSMSNHMLSEGTKGSNRKDSSGEAESGIDISAPTAVTATGTESCLIGSKKIKEVDQGSTSNNNLGSENNHKVEDVNKNVAEETVSPRIAI